MRRFFMLSAAAGLLAAGSSAAASLNKCIDAQGQVTYSNLPCRNARETRMVEIDPPPTPEPVKRTPTPPAAKPATAVAPAAKPSPAPATSAPIPVMPKPAPLPTEKPASTHLETRSTGKPAPHLSARQCDSLSDKLGKVFDQMDQARHSGYTQAQMDQWNREAQELERKKQQSGCF